MCQSFAWVYLVLPAPCVSLVCTVIVGMFISFLLVFYVDTILLVTEPCVLELGIEIPPALFFLL